MKVGWQSRAVTFTNTASISPRINGQSCETLHLWSGALIQSCSDSACPHVACNCRVYRRRVCLFLFCSACFLVLIKFEVRWHIIWLLLRKQEGFLDPCFLDTRRHPAVVIWFYYLTLLSDCVACLQRLVSKRQTALPRRAVLWARPRTRHSVQRRRFSVVVMTNGQGRSGPLYTSVAPRHCLCLVLLATLAKVHLV